MAQGEGHPPQGTGGSMSNRRDMLLNVMHRTQSAATSAAVGYYTTDEDYSTHFHAEFLKELREIARIAGFELVKSEDAPKDDKPKSIFGKDGKISNCVVLQIEGSGVFDVENATYKHCHITTCLSTRHDKYGNTIVPMSHAAIYSLALWAGLFNKGSEG